ncbi:MAG: terminase large subunit [Lactobacillaceae bacterium]|jgi:phage terminase large subunit-like protein|nr:terminase large subunit [Lactobacillaceae bacterium]
MALKWTDKVSKYAEKVVKNDILSGELMILAAKRHLKDMGRQETPDFPYKFDEKLLDKFLGFASLVPDPDEGVPLPLMDWEIFLLGSLVGWRNTKTGGKRFRQAIVSIARSQGKTYIAAILATYDFFVQSHGKKNQDIIVSANTTSQTKKIFSYTSGTVSALLNSVFKMFDDNIFPRSMDIVDKENHNQIIRISAEGGKYDGYHATTAIFDEAGDQKNRDAFGKITSGMIKNENALFLLISTAYQSPNAPFREDIKNGKDAIEKDERSYDSTFLAVWSQDDASEVFKPEMWIKSNPLLGLKNQKVVLLNGLISERDSKMREGKINDFIVKNMNVWLNAEENAAFELDDVERTVVTDFDMYGREVYIGFDNSMTSDDAALAFVFPYLNDDGEQRWHLYQHSFIPWHKAGSIEAKESQDGMNYRHMEKLGFASITEHDKGLINNDSIYQWLMEFVENNQLKVKYFAYDAMHTYAFIKSILEATEWTALPVRQGSLSLTEPTRWLQNAFVEDRVTHFDDPLMQKSLMNAVIVDGGNNDIKIDKSKATYKIDLVDALIDALVEGINHFEDFANQTDGDAYQKMDTDELTKYILSEDFGF